VKDKVDDFSLQTEFLTEDEKEAIRKAAEKGGITIVI